MSSIERRLQAIKQLCNAEIARAEAVVFASQGKKKLHQPVVDVYRGSLLVAQKILTVLDDIDPVRYNRGKLLEWYVAARSDGWTCEAFHPAGDHWEQAILLKRGFTADINIPNGTLVVYRPDETQINEPIPYSKQDYRTRARRRS